MLERIVNYSFEEIKNGFTFNKETESYICGICGESFESGEVFRVGDRLFTAEKMIKYHIREAHSSQLNVLLSLDKKYTGVTDNQKELLEMIYAGHSDKEIAKNTGVAPATIRHQRFVFREKAKQARIYLAIYELATEGAELNEVNPNYSDDEIIDVHKGAKMVDERYMVTKAEEEKIIQAVFKSIAPLKLKVFSSREKKKIVILRKIAEQFDKDKRYSEKEVNVILKAIYDDFATIRRYLIEYGFMERTNDCREYWLTKSNQ